MRTAKIRPDLRLAWPKSLTCPQGVWGERKNLLAIISIFSLSPQSRSLFSASSQTFCLTARAYLNTQKYGLFCNLLFLPNKAYVITFIVTCFYLHLYITQWFWRLLLRAHSFLQLRVTRPSFNVSMFNAQCLLKFGIIESNVTVFQWPWNSESG